MPTYAYRCSGCQNAFNVLRAADERDRSAECPECHGESSRVLSIPSVQIDGGDVQNSFMYRAGKAMSKAKDERVSHEERFGKYNEYTNSLPKPDHEEGPGDITRLGNVTTDDADAAFAQ